MKKSQILAAIALAFALGVVAPIATVSNANAVTIQDGQILSSKADVQATVDAIEKNTEYQQYKALINALGMKDAGGNAITDNTVQTTDINNLGDKIKALATGTTPSGAAYDYSTYAVPTVGSNASKMQTVIDDAKAAIANVTGKNYKLWSNLYEAYNSTSTAISEDQKAQNVVEAAEALGMTVKDFVPGTTTFAQVKAQIDTTSYNTYAATIALINADQVKVDDIDTVIEALTAALAPFAKAQTISESAATSTPIASLTALKPDITTAGTGKNYADLVAAVATTVTNLEDGDYDDLETDGAAATAQITVLKGAYKTATGSDLNTPSQPTDPSDPSNPDNEGEAVIYGGNVTIGAEGFKFPAGTKVVVKEVTAKDIEGFAGFGELKNNIYDIEIQNADGSKFDMTGKKVAVIIAVGGYTEKAEAFHIDNGSAKAIEGEEYKEGVMRFTTDHFSYYAVVEPATGSNGSGTTPETPESGTIAKAEGTASATGILAGIAAALTAAGAAVVAFRNARRNAKKNA